MLDLTYINQHFKDGSWDEESLNKIFILKKKDNNLLIKYKKADKNTLKLFRSVVLDETKIVCISPPKSVSYDENKSYKLYDFVEGTMMNAWYDSNKKNWRIASKSIIDAENRFYESQKLFCEMFKECCESSKFSFDLLDKTTCYSFVFQHPENRIINVVEEPTLYIVAAYKNNNDNTFQKVDYMDLQHITFNSKVKLPSQYFTPVNKLVEKLKNKEVPLSNMGIVLVEDGSIYHCKVRNETFEIIKKFKMNNTKLIYTFLNLKRKKMDSMYIKLFPESIVEFNDYLNNYYSLVSYLYDLYYDINVSKCLDITSLDASYKINLRNIHTYYIQNLREKNIKINKKHIDDYIINLNNHIIINLMNNNQRLSSTSNNIC